MRMSFFVLVLSMVVLSTAALADGPELTVGRANESASKDVRSDVPGVMSFQGTLTDEHGVAMDTTVSMAFSIYSDSTGGTAVWTETQPAVVVSSGLFNVLLGRVNSIPDTVFKDPSRWLGVKVGGDPELSSRQRLAAVGYAFWAAEADTAEYARTAVAAGDSDWTISGDDLYCAQPGKVGIGTASPQSKLHVDGALRLGAGTARYEILMVTPSTGGGWKDYIDFGGIGIGSDHGTNRQMFMFADGAGSNNIFTAATSENGGSSWEADFVIQQDGKVGIGTSSPTSPLTIQTINGTDIAFTATGNNADIMAPSTLRISTTSGGYPLHFLTNDMYRVIISGTGDVGIGTTSPAAKLDVSGDINADSLYKIGGNTVLSVTDLDNLFVGDGAGTNNTGNQGTFVGDQAGHNNQGAQNTFLGKATGLSNADGFQNTFVGSNAGVSNTSGYYNTFLGSHAGGDNLTGNFNAFLGAYAGDGATGSENTFLGYFAGAYDTAGSGNVFLGHKAGMNEIGSDKLYIANGPDTSDVIIYGDFSTGNVGLGTLTPSERLDVAGGRIGGVGEPDSDDDAANKAYVDSMAGGVAGSNMQVIYNDNGMAAGAQVYYDNGTGNVGIGITSPAQKLQIGGTDTRLLIQGGGTNTGMAIDFTGTSGRRYDILSTGASDPIAAGKLKIRDVTGGMDVFIIESGSVGIRKRPANELSVDGDADFTGNVGIGTTSPERDLHILGANPRILIEASSVSPEINFKNSDDLAAEIWSLYKHGTTDDLHFYQNGDKVIIQNNTGNVGIGTTNPGYKLEVTSSSGSAAHFLTTQNSTSAYGCKGEAVPGGNTDAVGVYGLCEPADGYGWGVYGQGGITGVQGVCLHFTTGKSAYGVFGQASYGTTNYGVYGQANDGSTSYGVYGYAFNATTNYGVYYSGGLGGSGSKSAIVRTEEGPMAVYCQESPENWFEDFGSGTIYGGDAEIELARDFRLTVTLNGSYPMKVFITPLADIGRWWVEKGTTGFTLMAPEAPEGAEFDFRVVAKRRGYEDLRLEKTTGSYADRFLYPDVNDVPLEYRDLWLKAARKELQTQ